MTDSQNPAQTCASAVQSTLQWIDSQSIPPETLSETFQLLANHRRRATVRVVQTHGELTLADLAEEVSRREFDTEIDEISAETVTIVYNSLYHDHLPQLTDAGVLEYEQERDLVSPAWSDKVDL